MGMGKQWKIQVRYILFSQQVSIRQYIFSAFYDLQNGNYFKFYLFLRSYLIHLPNSNKSRFIPFEHTNHRYFLQGIKFSYFFHFNAKSFSISGVLVDLLCISNYRNILRQRKFMVRVPYVPYIIIHYKMVTSLLLLF